MADVRTFHASTMQAALDQVRQELGADAVILQTRTVPQPRWLPWGSGREMVEVTAGLGIPVQQPAARSSRLAVTPTQAPPASAAAAYAAVSTPRQARVQSNSPPPATNRPATTTRPLTQESFPAQTTRSNPTPAPLAPSPVAPSSVTLDRSQLRPAPGAHPDEVINQLTALRKLVEQLQQRVVPPPHDLPAELYESYLQLLEAGVEAPIAGELIRRVHQVTGSEEWNDPHRMQLLLQGEMEHRLPCGGALRIVPGRRQVVALVGPTGVGKTTTIAKLAANFHLRAGLKVALVTVDTYRIAAVEQLRTYADIIELPMHVVTNATEMRQVLHELQNYDLVLIDTAGRSPRSDVQIQELNEILSAARPDETLLVLSTAASGPMLAETITRFSTVHPTGLILTKLDEPGHLGHLLTGLQGCTWTIHYLTTGQNVPEDIEPAHSARLAQSIWGRTTPSARVLQSEPVGVS